MGRHQHTISRNTTDKINQNPFPHQLSSFRIKLQEEQYKLAQYEFSWAGRLAAFKMMLLPQLLYLFRTLPIPTLTSYFKSLQSMLSRFVWKDKKPRCATAHIKLLKHRSAGGTGYVDFGDYYWATILTQIRDWFQHPPNTLWGNRESSYILHQPLNICLLSIYFDVPSYFPQPMKAWQKPTSISQSYSAN